MPTALQDVTTITFSYQNDNISLSIQSKEPIISVDQRQISAIPTTVLDKMYPLSTTAPLAVMTTMLADFKEIFKFANATIDQVVDETMNIFNNIDKFDRSQKVNALGVVSLRKSYAKYFYTVVKNKVYKTTNSVGGNSVQTSDRKKTAQIIIELVNWYFVRRFVHIYVVCTCLEKLLQLAVVATNNMPSTSSTGMPQPQPVNLSGTSGFASTPSTMTSQVTAPGTFQVPPALIQQQVSSLDAQLNRVNIVSSSGSAMTEADRSSLTKALQDTKNTLIGQQQQNVDLTKQLDNARKELDNLRELLLSSTSMIFKMDELLPTV
jgi:hypothetical protein